MFIRSVRVELLKLNGSLSLLLVVVVPALIGVMIFLALLTNPKPPSWQGIFVDFTLPIWTFFLLPMAVTAFCALLANVEHRSGIWDHWLSLPVPRWYYFASKAVVAIIGTWLMTALAVAFVYISAVIAMAITGRAPTGVIDWPSLIWIVTLIGASAGAFSMIQLWVSLQFSSFVVPLAVGILGTLTAIAVTMTRTQQADYFPWVLPVRVAQSANPLSPALAGLCGGFACALVMIIALQRRR